MMKPGRLCIFVLLPVALAACGRTGDVAPSEPVQPLQPQTAIARAANQAPLGVVPATISLPPAARVAVTAALSGAVRQLHVIEGQEVKKGQLLATVVSREALSLASDGARADARVDLARANANRIGQLAAEGVVAGARADEAKAALREALVDQSEAARALARAGAGADGVVRLVAPIAGRVSKITAETGGPLDGMTAPFVIEGGGRYSLRLQLPERLARQVRPGMAVVLADGTRGRVLSVAPGLDPATRSGQAIASVDGATGLLAGSSISATIVGDGESGSTAVPASAVTRLAGRDVVFVRSAKGFQPAPVVVGVTADGLSYIAAGLRPGAVVAISNLPELKSQASD
jgi:cobalt-zinc-cadmium efflux system membrane fusion protein